jgi:hypothetical protein
VSLRCYGRVGVSAPARPLGFLDYGRDESRAPGGKTRTAPRTAWGAQAQALRRHARTATSKAPTLALVGVKQGEGRRAVSYKAAELRR